MSALALLGIPDSAGDVVSVVLGVLGFAALFLVLQGLDRV